MTLGVGGGFWGLGVPVPGGVRAWCSVRKPGHRDPADAGAAGRAGRAVSSRGAGARGSMRRKGGRRIPAATPSATCTISSQSKRSALPTAGYSTECCCTTDAGARSGRLGVGGRLLLVRSSSDEVAGGDARSSRKAGPTDPSTGCRLPVVFARSGSSTSPAEHAMATAHGASVLAFATAAIDPSSRASQNCW